MQSNNKSQYVTVSSTFNIIIISSLFIALSIYKRAQATL